MLIKKNVILPCLLLLGVLLAAGCQTTVGVVGGTTKAVAGTVAAGAKGLAYGVESTAKGAAKDTTDLWQAILKADEWIKKNLW